jgi:hypothetical protein
MSSETSTQAGAVPNETKPGIYTTEFWATVIGVVLGIVQQALGPFNVGDRTVLIMQAVLLGAYNVSRGLSKSNVPYTPLPKATRRQRRRA